MCFAQKRSSSYYEKSNMKVNNTEELISGGPFFETAGDLPNGDFLDGRGVWPLESSPVLSSLAEPDQ
jgi:hypothetical protein